MTRLFSDLVFIVSMFINIFIAVYLVIDREKLSAELAAMKHDRAEVARIEQFIEKQAPHIHPATRRGFAEFTVETKWPIPND